MAPFRHLAALTLIGTTVSAQAAAPTDFSCSNRSAQIACMAAGCEVETSSFTPMGVSRAGSTLEVCAYTSCKSGTLDLIRVRGDLTFLHAILRGGEPAAVIYDRKAKTGTLMWSGFVQPINCGERE